MYKSFLQTVFRHHAFNLRLVVVLSPIYMVIAIAVKFGDPGPVLFKQKRAGLHMTFFYMTKFRDYEGEHT